VSALPPKADIVQHSCDVRFVPKEVGHDCRIPERKPGDIELVQ